VIEKFVLWLQSRRLLVAIAEEQKRQARKLQRELRLRDATLATARADAERYRALLSDAEHKIGKLESELAISHDAEKTAATIIHNWQATIEANIAVMRRLREGGQEN
jgi:hypothetical protein